MILNVGPLIMDLRTEGRCLNNGWLWEDQSRARPTDFLRVPTEPTHVLPWRRQRNHEFNQLELTCN